MAEEFGYSVTQFHHAIEAYKIRDVLAKKGICGSMWSGWFGFKMESLDGIEENVALIHDAGGCAVVDSDSAVGIQRLNLDAAKALAAGRRIGLKITDGEAIKWVTSWLTSRTSCPIMRILRPPTACRRMQRLRPSRKIPLRCGGSLTSTARWRKVKRLM